VLLDLQLWHLLRVRRQRFLTLMMGVPGSPAPAPIRRFVVDICYVDGGRSHIFVSTSQGSSGAAACPRGSGSHLPAQGSSGVATCPRAPAPASRLIVAPGPPRVAWAPAPAFWLRVAPELPRVPWTGSTSCNQLNKISLSTRPS
jgi:hypothetical protein